LRIAVWHNLPSGGGKRALYDHVRGLLERGHAVEAWCPPTADQEYLPLGRLVTEHVIPFEWQQPPARLPHSRLLWQYRQPLAMMRGMDEHCRRCAAEINAGGFDLLLANPCRLFRTTPIGRYVKGPKALYLQEPARWLYEAMPQLPWVAQPVPDTLLSATYWKDYLRDFFKVQGLRVQAREELMNARAYDAILVNSLFSRESVLRSYGLNARVCYLGVDTERFVHRQLPREQFVVGIGAIVPEKNIALVIEALGRVPAPRPRLVWVANVAEPSHLEELKRLASGLDVEAEFKVNVSDEQLIEILNRGLMMVYAPRLEPFGFAPLEANACGMPVVAVAEGGVRETVEHGVNGLLVRHDAGEMAEAIRLLSEDKRYAAELGRNGCRIVREKWSLNSAIDNLERSLSEVLTRSPASRPEHELSERALSR
jgi:glycosyltransferase involved in cell wall biosynthesis